jgi:3-methyladenine DNA glycosylase AlkD
VSPSAPVLAPAELEPKVTSTSPPTARRTKGTLDPRRQHARELGRALETVFDDADAISSQLRTALVELSDEPYRKELQRVAPGITDVIGVRNPLIGALIGGLRPALRRARPAEALFIAERLSRQDELELRQVSLAFLRRSLADDPERTWQLMRRLGRRATDWISVDSLAGLFAEGILREPFRWAEIEQIVYAESPWERRLAAATVALLRSTARGLAARGVIAQRLGSSEVARGLEVLGSLLGDADPNVRKALSWALRELTPVDRAQVTVFVTAQADRAAAERDGNRAWVIRDALSKLDTHDAHAIRDRLVGVRRTHGDASTSIASTVASRFGRLPDPRSLPEPPL